MQILTIICTLDMHKHCETIIGVGFSTIGVSSPEMAVNPKHVGSN